MHTDRGDLSAPRTGDALGGAGCSRATATSPRTRPCRAGLEVHPHGEGDDLELWIDRSYAPAGYGWSFPADDELRIGVGSFHPRYHVKEPTQRLAEDLGEDAVRYQGNWIPHKIRPAADDGCSSRATRPATACRTAEGIGTAWYFGIACVGELQRVLDGAMTRDQALETYAAFSQRHPWKFDWMLRRRKPSRASRRGSSAASWRDGPPRLLALGVRSLPEDRPARRQIGCRARRWRSR